jgi:hypothetical protein
MNVAKTNKTTSPYQFEWLNECLDALEVDRDLLPAEIAASDSSVVSHLTHAVAIGSPMALFRHNETIRSMRDSQLESVLRSHADQITQLNTAFFERFDSATRSLTTALDKAKTSLAELNN